MIELAAADLANCAGIGVAGNFAGHLEQAGEAADFVAVASAPEAPKGIFPWFWPGDDGFLGQYPLSSDHLLLPADEPAANVQIEPEAGVLCAVEYEDGVVTRLLPQVLGAFNDASVRRAGANKISEKKNWGAASKGFARRCFEVDEIQPDGACRDLRLACFLRRAEECFAYGVDSPLAGYSYFGKELLDWIVERLDEQEDDGPLEDVGAGLRAAGLPARILIGIGATRYSDFGEHNFVQPGDESLVIIYDERTNSADAVAAAAAARSEDRLAEASVLCQQVSR